MRIVNLPTLVVDFKDLKNNQLFTFTCYNKVNDPRTLYRKIISRNGYNAIPESKSGEGEAGGLIAVAPNASVVPFL